MQQVYLNMELLHRETKDENFSVIIVDFQSDDMDVEQALKEKHCAQVSSDSCLSTFQLSPAEQSPCIDLHRRILHVSPALARIVVIPEKNNSLYQFFFLFLALCVGMII